MIKIKEVKGLNFTFDGVKILPHNSVCNGRVKLDLSYKTALLYIDGSNVCTFYPTKNNPSDYWVDTIKEYCIDYGVDISDEEALSLSIFAINNIR